MPNICFLLGGFQGNGGIGRSTSIVVNALAKKEEYNITTVAYLQTDKPLLYEISPEVDMQHLYTHNISMIKAIIKGKAIQKLVKIIKSSDADIIVACGALYYVLGLIAAKICGKKCYCWEHTNPAITNDYKFQGVARKLAVRLADKIVVLTKSAENFYLNNLKVKKGKLIQIYNPVSDEAVVSEEYNTDSKKIISVGRLSYPKNFGLLIDVAAEILPKYPDWSWDVYGRGEEYDSLLEKIEQKGLNGKVNLMGQVYDIYERYGNYAFQVMTSRYEGFPMSLIEGASNKLPLISFDIETGPSEIIEDGINGFLVDAGNTEMMIDRIEKLINDLALREKMSAESYELNKRFSLDVIMERWCNLVEKT